MTTGPSLGPLAAAVADATGEAMELVPRLWQRDHTVWQEDPTEVADRLGWLDAPSRAETLVPRLEELTAEVVADGVTDVLLVGMGGSSLFPQVLATVYGPAPGRPRLHVLDSTDPAAVLAIERALPWATTLLVPASKSGTTIEMVAHLERFLARLVDVHGTADAGRFVVPITDPGTALDGRVDGDGFRAAVHGDLDVGGRFAALTWRPPAPGSRPLARPTPRSTLQRSWARRWPRRRGRGTTSSRSCCPRTSPRSEHGWSS